MLSEKQTKQNKKEIRRRPTRINEIVDGSQNENVTKLLHFLLGENGRALQSVFQRVATVTVNRQERIVTFYAKQENVNSYTNKEKKDSIINNVTKAPSLSSLTMDGDSSFFLFCFSLLFLLLFQLWLDNPINKRISRGFQSFTERNKQWKAVLSRCS